MGNKNKYGHFNILLLFLLICSSCAQQLVIPYSSDANVNGQIFLKPIKPTTKTFIRLNDSLIVDKKFIKSITIEHVPDGQYVINYVSNVKTYTRELDTTMTIVVNDQKNIAKEIDVPPHNSWYYISNILVGLVLILPFIIF